MPTALADILETGDNFVPYRARLNQTIDAAGLKGLEAGHVRVFIFLFLFPYKRLFFSGIGYVSDVALI